MQRARLKAWQPVIGLELHVRLKGNLKLFSLPAAAASADSVNVAVAPFDSALPGTLPRLNPRSLRAAISLCLAVGAQVNERSTFDRKHYFYPDLPSGYQITQKYAPLGFGGNVTFRLRDVQESVRIKQIQLEQDTAKSFHDAAEGTTWLNLDRAGGALLEIVSEPDLRSPEAAGAYVRSLQAVLRRLGVSDANMDKGELRCDANISVRPADSSTYGTRCEIKNLNGIRYLEDALSHEIDRHIGALESGHAVPAESRSYDPQRRTTALLRDKSLDPDYRYMPDPELGEISVSEHELYRLRDTLPEMPSATLARLTQQYGLGAREADILVAAEEAQYARGCPLERLHAVQLFEQVTQGRQPRVAANWIIHDLFGLLNRQSILLEDSPVTSSGLGALIDAVETKRITKSTGKALLESFILSAPDSRRGLDSLVSEAVAEGADTPDTAVTCRMVIDALPEEAEKVRRGNKKVIARLVGEAMKQTRGRGDARQLSSEFERLVKA